MMKFKSYYFLLFASLSLFVSFNPALSQVLYRATVTYTNGESISQVASSNNVNQLAASIYRLIKPQGNPRQNVTISLGTVNLNTLQNLLRSKGISAEYYEHLGLSLASKPNTKNWKLTSLSSIRSKSKFYGVVLKKSGYAGTSQIPFKVTQLRNNIPTLKFELSKVSLNDGTTITFAIDAGNSGLKPTQLGELLTTKDSRLLEMPPITNAPLPSGCPSSAPNQRNPGSPVNQNAPIPSGCPSSPLNQRNPGSPTDQNAPLPSGCPSSPQIQRPCTEGSNSADYLIKLSRN